MIHARLSLLVSAGALALALAGCGGGGSGSTPPASLPADTSSSSITPEQQSVIVSTTTHEIGSSMETGLGGGAVASVQRQGEALNPCITPSPKPPVIDPNGIPQNETYTYTNCTNLGWAAGETVNGQVNITDTSTGSTLSYTQTNTNLSLSGTENGNPYTEVRNGQRFPSLVNNQISVTRAMQVTRTTVNGTANVGQNWQWTFTPAAGTTLALLKPLPAGQFTAATGTITWARAAENFTLNFSITQPLAYDPTCTTPPRITAGVVSFTRTGTGKNTGSFTATFTACGVPPTITKTS